MLEELKTLEMWHDYDGTDFEEGKARICTLEEVFDYVITEKGHVDMRYIIETTKTDAGTRTLPITEDVAQMFQAIIEDRVPPKVEKVIDGYSGWRSSGKHGQRLRRRMKNRCHRKCLWRFKLAIHCNKGIADIRFRKS